MESLENIQEAVRAMIIKAIANFENASKDRKTVSYIETRLDTLEQQWQLFFNNHVEIISKVDPTELHNSDYYNNDVYGEVEELYIGYKSDLKENLSKVMKNTADLSSSKMKTESINFKLPEIKLPIFSGNYLEWQPFKELFVGLVDKNKSLDDAQKLFYLKSYLTGEAAELLKNISISSGNYCRSWEKLESTYNNKRYLANNILKRLFNQHCLTSESAHDIKKLVSTTTDCLESLKNLGVDVSSWDILIVFVISSKLDKASRKAWELNIASDGTDNLPTYEAFCQFMTKRSRGLENLDSGSFTDKVPKSSQPCHIQSFHIQSRTEEIPKTANSCLYCKLNHKISQCAKFKKERNETRRKFARENELCFICLYNNHTAKACRTNFKCHLCKKQHHTLLHPSGGLRSAGERSAGDRSVLGSEGHREKPVPFREGERSCVDDNSRTPERKYRYVNKGLDSRGINEKYYGESTKETRTCMYKLN